MDPWKLGLTLQGRYFNYKDLLAYSSDRIISSETDPWEKEIFRFIINWLSDSDHIVQYSSGTTGKPKQLKLSKKSMMQSAINTGSFFNLKKEDTVLLCMPTDYIAGKMMIVRSLVSGLNMLITEPKSVPDIHHASVIDFCAMVPLQVTNLLMCRKDLLPIKKLLIGGAEISKVLESLLQPLTTEAYASYGMAETCSHVAIRKLNGPGKRKEYAALQGISLSTDERDCLVITASYLPKPVVTNDVVELTGENEFLWKGRYDNLINSGGIKIVPEEVESIIMEHLQLECIAVGLPDKKLGNKLILVVENEKLPEALPDFLERIGNILPRHCKPKEIICIERFPRNDSMKIDRIKLLEMIQYRGV